MQYCAVILRTISATLSFCIYQKKAVLFLQEDKVDPARILLRIAACLETNSITVGQNYVNFLVNHDMKSPLIFEKIFRREI